MDKLPEREPSQAQFERRIKYDKLLLAILDRRHIIETNLEKCATRSEHHFSGVHIEDYEPPEILDKYIMPFDDITFEIDACADDTRNSTIESISLYPSDSLPVTITLEIADLFTLRCGDEVELIDHAQAEDILRQTVPATVRNNASLKQILLYLSELSPQSTKLLEHKIIDGTTGDCRVVRFMKAETADDSIEELEVFAVAPHATGAYVGTHMVFTEALYRRRKEISPDVIDHRLQIEAVNGGGESDTLFENPYFDAHDWSLPLKYPVQRHLRDIVSALKDLRE